MKEQEPYYLNKNDIRWREDELPSQITISQSDEVPQTSWMLEINPDQTANPLFPPEPFFNYPEVPLLDTPPTSFPFHEHLGVWMGAFESGLHGNPYSTMWEQPFINSLPVGNAPLPLQQSSIPNEYEGWPFILPEMDYSHPPSELQQVHGPYGTFMESVQSTEDIPPTSCDNSSPGIDKIAQLKPLSTQTAPSEEACVAQAESEKPYSYLIYRALRSADKHRLTLPEIYCWFEQNTRKASSQSSKSWKSSVRYNLSVNMTNQKSATGRSQRRLFTMVYSPQHAVVAIRQESPAFHHDFNEGNSIGKPIFMALAGPSPESFVTVP